MNLLISTGEYPCGSASFSALGITNVGVSSGPLLFRLVFQNRQAQLTRRLSHQLIFRTSLFATVLDHQAFRSMKGMSAVVISFLEILAE
jgi:hypothetical protein